MAKHNDIIINGHVTVKVDAVDIEQVEINHPGIANDHTYIQVFTAAKEKESFMAINRTLMKSGYILVSDDYKYAGGGNFEVTFIAKEMADRDEAAA